MLAVLAACSAIAVIELRVPMGGLCPDAVFDHGAVSFVYGDGKDGWYRGSGSKAPVRINSIPGTVIAGGERGPKIAALGDRTFAVWQGDYRQGPHVWVSRGDAKGFETQRDLLDAKTPGIDQVAVASQANKVVVLWLDGRGGQDADNPVTSTIWYALSRDAGATFGPNREIMALPRLRACACCSFAARFGSDGRLEVTYRGGCFNVRDIWRAVGTPESDEWKVAQLTHTGWKFEGCPMDGPRAAGSHFAYSINGQCYADGAVLGAGKYANVSSSGIATWQDGNRMFWKNLDTGHRGSFDGVAARVAVIVRSDGTVVIVH